MTMKLAGDASTQSRGRRPLPAGVVRAVTLEVDGVCESTQFIRADGTEYQQDLLSWVAGQSGILWGGDGAKILDRWPGFEFEGPGSYGHRVEYELADLLGQVFQGLLTSEDMAVRFFANGSDACSAAARVARAVGRRDRILSLGYHGSHLDYAHAPNVKGIPFTALQLHEHGEFGLVAVGLETLVEYSGLILEIPAWDDDEEIKRYLSFYRAACDLANIPLIIDDVVLGFRLALGGSAEYYGIKPDMVILGKAMSALGGVSAVIGAADTVGRLGDDVFYSTTFGGHPMLCGAAAQTVEYLIKHRAEVYGPEGHLVKIGQALKTGLNQVFAQQKLEAQVVGQPVRSILAFEEGDAARRKWCGQMIGAGVVMDRPQFPTLVHSLADVEFTLEAARKIGPQLP